MLLKQRMRTAIVGGGIRGMTLAMSLLDAAIEDVDIYESATAVKELGVTSISLSCPNAVRELTGLGLLDARTVSGSPPPSTSSILPRTTSHVS